MSCVALASGGMPARAQSNVWDSTISNTHWYVPTDQLIAYMTSNTSFSNPTAIGDQTLWAIGTSTNGVFSGLSEAELKIGAATITQNSTMQGVVTTSGQITILFTPQGGGATTVGLGYMRDINGVPSMEMQMITGDTLMVTHWAYMLPYDPNTFTPPASAPVLANSVPQWAWSVNTPWNIVSPAVFGTNQPGRFIITNYQNGYFWGRAIGPTGSEYTLLGSITPEGKVLLATNSGTTITTVYGDIAGSASSAEMSLEAYDPVTGTFSGDFTTVSLIPPYTNGVSNPSAAGAADALYRIAGTSTGLDGAMAPVIEMLNSLSGSALSTAISQTTPALAGSIGRASYQAQRPFQRVVASRVAGLSAAVSGDGLQLASADVSVGTSEVRFVPRFADEPSPERAYRVWIRPFAGSSRQKSLDGMAGYRGHGGGLAAGIERDVLPGLALGGAAGFSSSSIRGNDETVPNTVGVRSYQAGLYGALALPADLTARFEVDAALNRIRQNRGITFMNTSASARYSSISLHVGSGIEKSIRVAPRVTLTPAVSLDYAYVRTDAYSEKDAGVLNLSVDAQSYRELIPRVGLSAGYEIADGLDLIARVGLGYNILDRDTQIVAAYEGDGESFVTTGLDVSPWSYSAGIGLGYGDNGVDLGLHYDVEGSPSGSLSQTASIVLRFRI